jgi:hypothetical protein
MYWYELACLCALLRCLANLTFILMLFIIVTAISPMLELFWAIRDHACKHCDAQDSARHEW